MPPIAPPPLRPPPQNPPGPALGTGKENVTAVPAAAGKSATGPTPVPVPVPAPAPVSATIATPIAPPITIPIVPLALSGPTTNSRKRKSTDDPAAALVDYDNISVDHIPCRENCDQVRRTVNSFVDSGAMTKTAFARQIGVSAKSLSGFLSEHGSYKGAGFAAYRAAWEYFEKRKLAGVPFNPKKARAATTATSTTGGEREGEGEETARAAPKPKTAPLGPGMNSAGADISGVHLPGEETDSVPVFDTCDEVRRKVNAHLKKPGVTQAQFCRDMLAMFKGPGRPANIQSIQLSRFRGMKGPTVGANSLVFYAAYVFFEKVRIAEGKPKSKHRVEMEKVWGEAGLDREHDGRQRYVYSL